MAESAASEDVQPQLLSRAEMERLLLGKCCLDVLRHLPPHEVAAWQRASNRLFSALGTAAGAADFYDQFVDF